MRQLRTIALAALVSMPACAPAPTDPAPAAETPAGTGRDECSPLAVVCVNAVASSHEGDRTIVFVKAAEPHGVLPGQWFHCVHDDRPPSSPCQLLGFVDSGMLEASCLPAAPAACAPS